jgi:Tol biopolymer transport system component
MALSPDGKWALARRGSETVLIPTGAGQPRPIAAAGIAFDRGGTFSPDGERLLLSGTASGASRVYEFTLETGAARAVTPEGTVLAEGIHAVSPDGRSVVARDTAGKWAIYDLASGGESTRPVEGLEGGEEPVRWTEDGRRLFVLDRSGSVRRLDPATGRGDLYRETRPGSVVHPTPDGAACVYGYRRDASDLLIVEGLE